MWEALFEFVFEIMCEAASEFFAEFIRDAFVDKQSFRIQSDADILLPTRKPIGKTRRHGLILDQSRYK